MKWVSDCPSPPRDPLAWMLGARFELVAKRAPALKSASSLLGAQKGNREAQLSAAVTARSTRLRPHVTPSGWRRIFAPSLLDSLKRLSYSDFASVVAGGRKDVNSANEKAMPSFGTDPNVMCYLDDMYVCLRPRSDGKLGSGRPIKHVDKPASATKAETRF
jgi:hypothetical protein